MLIDFHWGELVCNDSENAIKLLSKCIILNINKYNDYYYLFTTKNNVFTINL